MPGCNKWFVATAANASKYCQNRCPPAYVD
ncbi:DUF6076 domain-containing protein [Dermabacter vaginalis]